MSRASIIPPRAPEPLPARQEGRSSVPCKIFVSYAHKDEIALKSELGKYGYATAFVEALRVKLVYLRDMGIIDIPDAAVFFDGKRLAAEPYWEPAIEAALAQCDVFIFLVSMNWLGSDFCKSRELKTVCAREAPPLIIPVILHQWDGWFGYKVPGTEITLGRFNSGGLPKGPDNNVRPVLDWTGKEADAWNEVTKGIATAMSARYQSGRAQTEPVIGLPVTERRSTPRPQEDQPSPRLLPYFCNQQPQVEDFEDQLDAWHRSKQERALLILLKGEETDGLDKFSERLRFKYIQTRVKKMNRRLSTEKKFEWPFLEPREAARNMQRMVKRLHETLDLDPATADPNDPASLANSLTKSPLTYYLNVYIDSRFFNTVPIGLEALLRYLEGITERALLGRLIFVIYVDQPAFAKKAGLANAWGLSKYTSAHVIEVSRLKEVDRKDAEYWHKLFVQGDESAVSREDLLAAVFPDPARKLRLTEFARAVAPLLNKA